MRSVYYTDFGGFIFKNLTGNTCDATFSSCDGQSPGGGGDLNQLIFQQKDATFYGAELLVQHDVGPIWNGIWGVEGQYDFVHAKFDDGEYVPRMPPHRLGGGIYYHDAGGSRTPTCCTPSRRISSAPNETETGSYTLLNAELSYTFRGDKVAGIAPVTTIGLRGENLLDDDVRNSRIVQEGRGAAARRHRAAVRRREAELIWRPRQCNALTAQGKAWTAIAVGVHALLRGDLARLVITSALCVDHVFKDQRGASCRRAKSHTTPTMRTSTGRAAATPPCATAIMSTICTTGICITRTRTMSTST